MIAPRRLVLIGHPVAHSFSPTIQNAALRAALIPLEYTACDVASGELSTALHHLIIENSAGNVTIPHKQAIVSLCNKLTPIAQRAGAVNTFWTASGELVGDNTDVAGFDVAARSLLETNGRPLPRRITLLGAGGAASAIALATEGWPSARVTVWSRTAARMDELAQRFGHVRVATDLPGALADAELVINATPIGLESDDFPVETGALPPESVVMDLVYRQRETAWVHAARRSGHPAADGLTMLVEQAALAFQRWFGFEPDRAAMWRSVR